MPRVEARGREVVVQRVLVAALLLGGCERIEATDALVAPVVAQGLYLGLDLPEGVNIDGSDILDYSAACTVFLAYVSDPAALEESPVEGAGLTFKSEENGRIGLDEAGDGKYLVTAAEGLVYEPGDVSRVVLDVSGEEATIGVNPPEAPDVDFPPTVQKDEPFDVDLTGQGYENTLAAVYDTGRNRLTWSNLPAGVTDTYTFTHPEAPVESLEIPGDAFPGRGTYVVGVAGMRLADPDGFENVNTTLSAFMAGQFSLFVTIIQ